MWTPSDPAYPGRAAQLHTQGQSEFNSYWFPIRDFPNVRLSTEVIATVPAGFEVVSNGRLVDRAAVGAGRVRFHWSQERPHPPYLVSLVVGKFDVVDVARAGSVPMPVYVPPGRGRDVERTYGRTALMAELFARLIDEPYPWEKYAQVVVHNFEAGGMENTSATTMHDTAILTADGVADQDIEDLIAHELAHQWFGNMITCRSWEHLWLNEGFATYFEALWLERQPLAPDRGLRRTQRQWSGRDLYLARVLEALDAFRDSDLPDAPRQPAMVSKEYRHADETFGRAADPYAKGAFVLHMLRTKLGDDVFFRGLAAYVDRFAFKEVETNDFRRVMEDVSGEALEAFFAQWCFRPGLPGVEITPAWEPRAGGGGELNLTVRQTQRIDRENPAFMIDLPVWIR
ncbi:M1 family metallopeptidase [Leptolyngbya sp. 15MV]|nr:M1 family metallopeptidase [Leptolyngbya sp. 15MV]